MQQKFGKTTLLFLLLFISIQNIYAGFGPFIAYHNDMYFSKRWGLHVDANWRHADFGIYAENLNYFALRTGVLFRLNPKAQKFKMTLSAGIAVRGSFYKSQIEDDSTGYFLGNSVFLFQENILYQQLGIQHQIIKPFSLEHRLRLEENFYNGIYFKKLGTVKDEPLKYYMTNLRYLIRPELTVYRKSDLFSLHVALQEELFVLLDYQWDYKVLAYENRLSVNFGVKLSSHTKIELGYLNWINRRRIWDNSYLNHMIHLQVLQSLNLFKTGK